jgi:cytochrome c oxidase assembly protein subunit 15
MSADSTAGRVPITRWHCALLLVATVLTTLLIMLGGIVCVTGSAQGCPDWPGCFGRIVPPPQINAIIEYLHRFVAALTSPFILAAAIVGWWKARRVRWVSWPPVVAIPFLLAVVVFGAIAVLRGLPRGWAAVDLGSALIVLALMTAATTAAFARRADPGLRDRLLVRDARLALAASSGVFVVLVSGILVAGKGSLTRCLGWPMWGIMSNDLPGWPQGVRLLVAGAAAVLISAAIVQAWQLQGRRVVLRRVAAATGALFLAEMAAGGIMLAGGFTIALLAIYAAAAVGLWALLIALTVLSGLIGFTAAPSADTLPAHAPSP